MGDLHVLPRAQMFSAAPQHCMGLLGRGRLNFLKDFFFFFNAGGCCVMPSILM